MFTIVVFHKESKKVILALPLEFDRSVGIKSLDTMIHRDYDYRVYDNMSPVFYKDEVGDICLKPNTFIVNSKSL